MLFAKTLKDPTIAPVNFKDGQWISKNETLKLKINDADTGIRSLPCHREW